MASVGYVIDTKDCLGRYPSVPEQFEPQDSQMRATPERRD